MTDLPPLPEPDGSAEANRRPHPQGGYTYDEIDAWSEPLVRAYATAAVAAADREWYGKLEAADAEIERLTAELSRCGKDNCMGRKSDAVTNWVTVEAMDAAVAAERERCAKEAEHWQTISTTPGHACGQYIAAAIRKGHA